MNLQTVQLTRDFWTSRSRVSQYRCERFGVFETLNSGSLSGNDRARIRMKGISFNSPKPEYRRPLPCSGAGQTPPARGPFAGAALVPVLCALCRQSCVFHTIARRLSGSRNHPTTPSHCATPGHRWARTSCAGAPDLPSRCPQPPPAPWAW